MGDRSTEYMPLDGIIPAAVNPKLSPCLGCGRPYELRGRSMAVHVGMSHPDRYLPLMIEMLARSKRSEVQGHRSTLRGFRYGSRLHPLRPSLEPCGMTERRLEYMPIDELTPAAKNPKKHAMELLADSLDQHGYTEPLLVDDRTGRLVVGHGRLEALQAAQAAGGEPPDGVTVADGRWMVPVVRGWASSDDYAASRYLVASNALVERGGWDDRALADLLAELGGDDPGLVGTGYGPDDLDDLLARLAAAEPPALPVALTDPDEVPEPPAVPVTNRGDLWLLGEHRLLCGDATDKADLDRVLGGEHLAGAVVTDPPYGVGIGAKNRALDAIDRADRVLTDLEGDQGIEEVEALWRDSFGVLFEVMAPGCPYYIFGPQGGDLGLLLLLLLLLRDSKLAPRHILIWVKNRPSFSIGRLDYDYQHEPIVYGWKPGGPHPWYSPTPQTSVFHVDRPQASPDHPTPKPVDLLTQLIANSVPRDGIVLDPFGGSGSTLIAAQQTGRVARLVEISPHYCDVICRRFANVTGTKPVLESTGEAHDFTA